MSLSKRAVAEFIGTFWLVLGGCGSAVLAAAFPHTGIGFLGVALAFGLTVLTMAFAIGHISGCHLNPAVSFGLMVGGRFRGSDLPAYVIAQVMGAIVAALVLYVIASGKAGFDLSGGLAANGYGEHSPGGYSLGSGLLTEVVMTFTVGGWALAQLWMFWVAPLIGAGLAGIAYRLLVAEAKGAAVPAAAPAPTKVSP
jgi:aquaporin Z